MKGTRRTTGLTRSTGNKEDTEGANMMKNVGTCQSFQLYSIEEGIAY